MRKVFVIARREYLASVRSKAFVITLVAMPLLMVGSVAVQALMEDKVDLSNRRLGVVDFTGQLYDVVEDASRERNRAAIFSNDGGEKKQVRPKFVLERIEPDGKDIDKLLFELSERVRSKELFAFVVLYSGAIDSKATDSEKNGRHANESMSSAEYYSNNPTYFDLSRWLAEVINAEVQHLRFQRVGLDPAVVAEATRRVSVDQLGLVTKDDSGKISKGEKTNRVVDFGVPVGLMMLMLMVVMVGASPLVQSVLEEKMQRIAEVLLGSVPPFQLMLGKLLGTVGVSLTISAIYLAGVYAMLQYLGYASFFPTHLLLWFVLYQSLAVLMFGSVFIAVGAAVSDLKESQSMLMPVMVLIMAPFFVWASVLKAPTAPFAVAVSLFPPATPMLMLLRQAIPPGVPIWQPIVGVIGVVATTLLFVFAAGRIFRIGILMQGKGAKLSDMVRWAIRG